MRERVDRGRDKRERFMSYTRGEGEREKEIRDLGQGDKIKGGPLWAHQLRPKAMFHNI